MADYRDGRAMQTGWVRFFKKPAKKISVVIKVIISHSKLIVSPGIGEGEFVF